MPLTNFALRCFFFCECDVFPFRDTAHWRIQGGGHLGRLPKALKFPSLSEFPRTGLLKSLDRISLPLLPSPSLVCQLNSPGLSDKPHRPYLTLSLDPSIEHRPIYPGHSDPVSTDSLIEVFGPDLSDSSFILRAALMEATLTRVHWARAA